MFSVAGEWVLHEHRIHHCYTLPGIVYVEMAREFGSDFFPEAALEIRDLMFINPLIVSAERDKEVQTIVQKRDGGLDFTIASKAGKEWTLHAQGKATVSVGLQPQLDLLKLQQTLPKAVAPYGFEEGAGGIEVGRRWNVVQELYGSETEVLAYLELPEEYRPEQDVYFLHPSLMDGAMNAAIRMIGNGLYLPWNYQSIKCYARLPAKCYSYLRRKDHGGAHSEAAVFDITVVDEQGFVLVEAAGYTIKKVNDAYRHFRQAEVPEGYYHMTWRPQEIEQPVCSDSGGPVLVFTGRAEQGARLIQQLRNQMESVIEVQSGDNYQKIDDNHYLIGGKEQDYHDLMANFITLGLRRIIHLQSINQEEVKTEQEWQEAQQNGVMSLFYLTRALLANRIKEEVDIVLIANEVYEVSKAEPRLNPQPAALFGLGKVVGQEYPKFQCRCIDIDDQTKVDEILRELNCWSKEYLVAYRNGIRYGQTLQELNISGGTEREIKFQQDGVYIITGGLGGIGLELGQYMARKAPVKLALFNRTRLPERTDWGTIVRQKTDAGLVRKITAIERMEA
ncbi:polyketide synthase dehydratase domain-containing protein, partial [Lacrimispora brassicae]